MGGGCGASTKVNGEYMEPIRVDNGECISVAANWMRTLFSDGMPELNAKTQRGETAAGELTRIWVPFLVSHISEAVRAVNVTNFNEMIWVTLVVMDCAFMAT